MTDTLLIPENTLITSTPEEGRHLAVKMARLVVKLTQPNADIRANLRETYENDPTMLILIAQVVATEFATIARANNYWHDS